MWFEICEYFIRNVIVNLIYLCGKSSVCVCVCVCWSTIAFHNGVETAVYYFYLTEIYVFIDGLLTEGLCQSSEQKVLLLWLLLHCDIRKLYIERPSNYEQVGCICLLRTWFCTDTIFWMMVIFSIQTAVINFDL